jgi:HSP20 family protein
VAARAATLGLATSNSKLETRNLVRKPPMFEFRRPWFDDIQREMERYLEHMAQRKPRTVVFSRHVWQPAADVYETDVAVVALLDLSGVPEESIDLVVERDSVTVRGERRDPCAVAEGRYSVLEIPCGPFERTLLLPAAVDPDRATATYRTGFLEVAMPKLVAQGPHRITVTDR